MQVAITDAFVMETFSGETHNKAKYDKIRPKTVSETLDLAGGPQKNPGQQIGMKGLVTCPQVQLDERLTCTHSIE